MMNSAIVRASCQAAAYRARCCSHSTTAFCTATFARPTATAAPLSSYQSKFTGHLFSQPITLSKRFAGGYEGQIVSDNQLIKKSDDWVIEETNFCLGRVANVRYKETDDLAHRVLHLMDTQLSKMHTRLRDGTCIPYTSFYLTDVLDSPTPLHIFQEAPIIKWTWDEVYDEAYDMPSVTTGGSQQSSEKLKG